MKHRLSEKWIKASIAGTLWAASEIVLGSFLHNLRVPFGGNILTAIGIIILISISYVWTDKGLFWRAGLICALMKTLSPSAVIFGPMIAILTESLLLELSVFVFGRSLAGYLAGSMLAMSWNLFQKIVNYLIMYGSDIALVYSSLLKMAQKQLNIQTDIVWLPIIALLVLFALFGLLSGAIGMIAGNRLIYQPAPEASTASAGAATRNKNQPSGTFKHSVAWLAADIILMIFSFIILNKTAWPYWSSFISGLIILWSFRYKRAFRRLSKPGFWLFFVVLTLVTAFVFTEAQSGDHSLKSGIITGIQMNFRAAVVVLGFTVIGTELYNPAIRNFFSATYFKNLPLALELSAESLPDFIAAIPDLKSLVRNPVSVFHTVISMAEKRLEEIKNMPSSQRKIFIITGPVGGGKTTFAEKLSGLLREEGITAGGIISRKVKDTDDKTGYDIVNILTGDQVPFLRQNAGCGNERVGKFTICKNGLDEGIRILSGLELPENGIAIIDEVGFLELRDEGWAGSIARLLKGSQCNIILTPRRTLLDKVKEKWGLAGAVIFDINEADCSDAGKIILEMTGTRVQVN
jgi:nucleoside-triphosphatase THEP1